MLCDAVDDAPAAGSCVPARVLTRLFFYHRHLHTLSGDKNCVFDGILDDHAEKSGLEW